MVDSRSPWDYKRLAKREIRINPVTGENEVFNRYESFGNFNYGATGGALGISLPDLFDAAGMIQVRNGTSKLEWGMHTNFDQPSDHRDIAAGYRWYQTHYKNKK